MNYKFNGKSIFITVTILIFFIGMIIYGSSILNHPLYSHKDNVVITVNEGDSLYKVLQDMKNNKQIKNLLLIKAYIKINRLNKSIKPGKYTISSNVTTKKLVYKLNTGEDSNLKKVTIPEGYDIANIAILLEKKGIINSDVFKKACRDYTMYKFVKHKGNRKYAIEGYLFPDTYNFAKGQSAKDIIHIMTERFNQVVGDIKNKYNIEDNEVDKILTIASIIEKEAEIDDERGKVASVFYNRMKKNMKMESCATVLYSLGEHRDKLYYKDLKVKSPYNTYKIKGLPPGPICNPGLSSIKSAITPDKTDYLYFVSYNNGTHFFTDKYSEFLKVKKTTQGN